MQDKERTKLKVKKAAKTDILTFLYATGSNKTLSLVKIQTQVKKKKFKLTWRKSIYHGILI